MSTIHYVYGQNIKQNSNRLLFLFMAIGLALSTFAATVTFRPAEAAFPGTNGKIVYVHDDNGRELWTVNPDGTDPSQLTDNGGNFQEDDEPNVSADGTKVVFARNDGLGGFDVWKINIDGTGETRLTNTPTDFTDPTPTWSPDGTQIAFASGTEDPSGEIHIMDADGTNQFRLTTLNGTTTRPVWSPDGSKIAFSSSHDGTFDIWTINVDGNNLEQITNLAGVTSDPDWSPDGSKITFTHAFPTQPFFIYEMDANGSNQTGLGVAGAAPEYSPDGSQIVYLPSPGFSDEIRIVNAGGGGDHSVPLTLDNDGFVVDWAPGEPADDVDPTITITTPSDGAVYQQNQAVNANYECYDEDGGSGLANCTGDVPNGSPIDTSTLGVHTFTVNAEDNAGNTTIQTHTYTVQLATPPSKEACKDGGWQNLGDQNGQAFNNQGECISWFNQL